MPRNREALDRALVTLCWVQIIVAASMFMILAIALGKAADPGFEWQLTSGVITSVRPGGPADLAGIRQGDRLAAGPAGVNTSSGYPPLYRILPGRAAPLLIERNENLRTISIVPVDRAKIRHLAPADGLGFFSAISDWLRIGINIVVLIMAAILLALRPSYGPARTMAAAMAFFVGGNELLDMPGFGGLMEPVVGTFLLSGLHSIDLLFRLGFFATIVQFSLIFPRPMGSRRQTRWMLVLPYLATLPVALIGLQRIHSFFFSRDLAVLALNYRRVDEVVNPTLLICALIIMAVQFRNVISGSERRRVWLVLAALIPAAFGYLFRTFVEAAGAGAFWLSVGRLIFWCGAATGSLILVWAIARHRVFGIRVSLRKSAQHGLARMILGAILLIPAGLLISLLWVHRADTLQKLFVKHWWEGALVALVWVLTVRLREKVAEFVDRRFFRDEYDARRALVQLVSLIQKGTDVRMHEKIILTETEKALHPEYVSIWRRDPEGLVFRPRLSLGIPRGEPALRADHELTTLLERRRSAVSVDLLNPSVDLRRHSSDGSYWIWLSVTGASLIVPIIVDSVLTGFILFGPKRSETEYSSEDMELLASVAAQLALTESYNKLESLASHDPLTEVLNRHAYYSLVRKSSSEERGSVAIVDIDEMKTINDTFGHAAGDIAIRQVASAIRALVRSDDLVFRWGGDEFLVILLGLDEAAARSRFEDLDRRLDDAAIESTIPASVSIGVRSFASLNELSRAIDEADADMYANKRASRETEPG